MRPLDLAGKKINKLTVISMVEDPRKGSWWLCRCDCGREKLLSGSELKKGYVKTCGCEHADLDLTGRRYGMLEVIGKSENKTGTGRPYWICKCDCGATTEMQSASFGKARSCGCVRTKDAGHKIMKHNGYVWVKINDKGGNSNLNYKYEHILVMEQMIGRQLMPGETVHHKNGIRSDNRPDNLELWASNHPSGQRVEDMVKFCVDYLLTYAPDRLHPSVATAG